VKVSAVSASEQHAESGESIGDHLGHYAVTELGHAVHCLGWRGSHLHAGIHQARKSMRRVRATLAFARRHFGRIADTIDRSLRISNESLSDLRDGQALVEAIDRLGKLEKSADAAAIIRRARSAAVKRRKQLTEEHASGDSIGKIGAKLEQLVDKMKALPWCTLGEDEVERALARSSTSMRAAARRAKRTGEDEDWHRWRRRLRRLSQQQRAVHGSAGYPEEAEKAVATLLGELQDFSLLAAHCKASSPFDSSDRKRLRKLARRQARRLRNEAARKVSRKKRKQRRS
jgi:CHAD domain-containing protein